VSRKRTILKPGRKTTGLAALHAENKRLQEELIFAKAKISEMEERADVDPLLDIFNRRGFERELKRTLAYIDRYGTEAALVYIDLDGFKGVNDRHGHAAGDAVLRAVAGRLANNVRASDVVARLGGDEFAVVLWNAGEEQATIKARGLERLIEHSIVTYRSARLKVGASAGVVTLRPHLDSAQVLDAADRAMYVRKKERKTK
jgi:diguanylate cyclase (GGDEF)-like protein